MDNNIVLKFTLSRGQFYLLNVLISLRAIIILSLITIITAIVWGVVFLSLYLSPYFIYLSVYMTQLTALLITAAAILVAYLIYVFGFGAIRLAFRSKRSPGYFGLRVVSIGEARAAVMYSDKNKQSFDLKVFVEHFENKRYLVYKHGNDLFIIDKEAFPQGGLQEFFKRLEIVRRAAAQSQK